MNTEEIRKAVEELKQMNIDAKRCLKEGDYSPHEECKINQRFNTVQTAINVLQQYLRLSEQEGMPREKDTSPKAIGSILHNTGFNEGSHACKLAFMKMVGVERIKKALYPITSYWTISKQDVGREFLVILVDKQKAAAVINASILGKEQGELARKQNVN